MHERLKDSEMQIQELNSLVLQLEKENESLKSTIEKLKVEIDCRTDETEKLQVSFANLESLKQTEFSNNEEKINKLNIQLKDLNDTINSLKHLEKEYQTESLQLKEILNEKQNIINMQENNEKELNMKIDYLEKEVKALNVLLKDINLKMEELKINEKEKIEELYEIQKNVKLLQLNEKVIKENLIKSENNSSNLLFEKEKLLSNIALLNDEILEVQNKLKKSEKDKSFMEVIIREAEVEIQNLNDCVYQKQELIMLSQKRLLDIQSSVASFEEEHSKSMGILREYKFAFSKILKKFNHFCKSEQVLDQILPIHNDDDIDDIVVFKDLENMFVENTFSKKEVFKKETFSQNQTNSDMQRVIEDLVQENSKLRRELHDIKEISDKQAIESAKNITELQKTLNDLHDERNNLSLVLQSIENESNNINPAVLLKCKNSLKENSIIETGFSKTHYSIQEINFMELNQKVKAEIEALSSQTELINHELTILREKFDFSQAALSEKVLHLNSKLLTRTELLLKLREDLDEALKNAESLKEILEDVTKQLDEKKEVLEFSQKEKKDLENKMKLLKDKSVKKELELKQAHNSQLSNLKDQTEITIKKLKEEIANLCSSIQSKDEEFAVEVSLIKDSHKKEIYKYNEVFNEVSRLKNIVEELLVNNKEIENKLLKNFSRLDEYYFKMDLTNSKLKLIKSQLNEKENLIQAQVAEINKLNKQRKDKAETEDSLKKTYEKEILSWKEKYETVLKDVESFTAATESNKLLLESQLMEQTNKLELELKKNLELTSAFNDAFVTHQTTSAKLIKLEECNAALETKLSSMSVIVEEAAHKESEDAAEVKAVYDTIMCLSNSLSSKIYEHTDRVISSLSLKEAKLKHLETRLLKCSESASSSASSVSQFQSQIRKSCQIVESCLLLLKETTTSNEFIQKEPKSNSDEIKLAMVGDDRNLDYLLQELEEELKLHMKKFVAHSNSLAITNRKVQEWEEKYGVTQELLDKSQVAFKELETKSQQMSCWMPVEEFEEHKRTYNNEIHELKNVIINLENEKVKHLKMLEEKENVIKALETKTNEMISMISSEEFENYKLLSNAEIKKCIVEIKELKDINKILESEIRKLETYKEEKEKIILEQQEEMSKIKFLSDKELEECKCRCKELNDVILNLQSEIGESLQNMENKESELKLIQINLANSDAQHEESQKCLKDKYENAEKNYTTQMKEMKKQIILLEKEKQALETKHSYLLKERDTQKEFQEKQQKSYEETILQLQTDLKSSFERNSELKEEINFLKKECIELVDKARKAEMLKISFSEKQLHENSEIIETYDKKPREEKLHSEYILPNHTLEVDKELIEIQKECNEEIYSHFKDIESDYTALLKQVKQQISCIQNLEKERDNLKLENASILEQLHLLKSSPCENELLTSQTILEGTVQNSTNNSQQLEKENEQLKSEISAFKKSCEEISCLKDKNESLSKQITLLEKLDPSDPSSQSVKEYIASVRRDCEKTIKASEEDMEAKLKLLVRDFAEQMDCKDRDCDKIASEMLERNQDLEERLIREHKNEIVDLRQSLFEKECALDDIRDDYEEKLQEKDKKLKECETIIKNLSHSGNRTSPDSALLTAESSDWDDTWAVPDESIETITSPIHSNSHCEEHVQEIETLKEELSQCNSEIKELKVLLRLSPPESMVNNTNRQDSLQSLPEPTEFEYLKNIIYEYMMGKEPITLVKVIAAVLRFSEAQTQQVVRKEESKHQTK